MKRLQKKYLNIKIRRLIALLFISNLLFICSCVSRKKITYLRYNKSDWVDKVLEEGDVNKTSAYKIMPYDNLFIRVMTPDPRWSEIFNSATGEGTITEESAILTGYPVDDEGNIEIPFVGKVNVQGKTLKELKKDLESTFSSYVTDASITVRLVNNHISILGEVVAPGRYPLTKDRVNIFEALSMAGDLREYSDRRKMKLIRQTSYGPIVKEFTLSDRSVLSSEFYYVMPNDILYAPPLKGRAFQANAPFITLALTIINTGLVVYALIQDN